MGDLIHIDVRDGIPVVPSRQVAENFEKRHDAVLRDIRNLECSEEFRLHNFVESSYRNEQNREMPLYWLTRDGFTFLAMGFTGEKAARWKEKYIAAFNAMEQKLSRDLLRTDRLDTAIEILTQLQAESRQDIKETKFEVLSIKHDMAAGLHQLSSRVSVIEDCVRREITSQTKARHRAVFLWLGCRCPLCNQEVKPNKLEFEHFHGPKWNEFTHTWPVCRECHKAITGKLHRTGEVLHAFTLYQERARKYEEKQPKQLALLQLER